MLGDKEVDYDPRFRMYLMTKHANPQLNPAIYAKATVINYMVTTNVRNISSQYANVKCQIETNALVDSRPRNLCTSCIFSSIFAIQGLEEQLLSVVVQTERPDVEEQREALISETSALKASLQQLEDSLLREIASNQGNMLDNVELIETLEGAKASATEVSIKLADAVITANQIDKLRNDYRLAARRGAILFFVLSDMAIVNSMYQYSLNSYLEVCCTCVDIIDIFNSLRNSVLEIVNLFFTYISLLTC